MPEGPFIMYLEYSHIAQELLKPNCSKVGLDLVHYIELLVYLGQACEAMVLIQRSIPCRLAAPPPPSSSVSNFQMTSLSLVQTCQNIGGANQISGAKCGKS